VRRKYPYPGIALFPFGGISKKHLPEISLPSVLSFKRGCGKKMKGKPFLASQYEKMRPAGTSRPQTAISSFLIIQGTIRQVLYIL